MDRKLSRQAFERARRSIVGGVNSPVRSFSAVSADPVFATRGEGPYLYDTDGNRYTDFLMSWGAIILGHADQHIIEAIERAAKDGCGFGLSTEVEAEMAELVRQAFPSIELMRMVNSGTEAVMSAIRLARGYTGRKKVLMFEGGYHGHCDSLLARAGSGLATLSLPRSGGVCPSQTADTLIGQYNDLNSVEALLHQYGDDVACILVEPVAGNMGVVAPEDGFLTGLREMCDRSGALLIFDEVITGFRIAWGGAQERFGLRADLTTLGKIIGGGLPVGAFGGRRDIMEHLAPLGDVYQAGTLSGNPVVLSAGVSALRQLQHRNAYRQLDAAVAKLTGAIVATADEIGVDVFLSRVGPIWTLFFTDQPVRDYTSARLADADRYAAFFRAMLNRGLLVAPSQWEAAFVGLAHLQEGVLDKAAENAGEAIRSLA